MAVSPVVSHEPLHRINDGEDRTILMALARLFAALADVERATRNARAANRWVYEDDERLAYSVVRTTDPIGFAQLAAELEEVPPQLEGLYAGLDELVLGSNASGGECDHRVADYAEIDPVSRTEVVDIEDDACVLLHQQAMGEMLLLRLREGAAVDLEVRGAPEGRRAFDRRVLRSARDPALGLSTSVPPRDKQERCRGVAG